MQNLTVKCGLVRIHSSRTSPSLRFFAGLLMAALVLLAFPAIAQDYGDAPDTGAGTGTGNYQTTDTDGGPSHILTSGLSLGATIDADDGTLQNAAATADDNSNTGSANDEDGVASGSLPPITNSTTSLSVDVAVTNGTANAALVYCYFDFNRDGDFTDAGERSDLQGVSPTTTSTVTVNFSGFAPPTPGLSYLRCRLGELLGDVETPIGAATSGEVEDYAINIDGEADYGDAPSSYGDPNHVIPTSPQFFIGGFPAPDAETGTQSGVDADGDDANGDDDENGVTFTVRFGSVQSTVTVTDFSDSNNFGTLCAWLDGSGSGGAVNGAFDNSEGQCLDVASICTGNTIQRSCPLTWDVSNLSAGTITYARFRYSTGSLTTADGSAGTASDGEVEDYRIDIQDLDAGDAPGTSASPVDVDGILRRYGVVTHVLSPNLYIGTVAPDADTSSNANNLANGDDNTDTDDEEGVVLTLGAGFTAVVTVTNNTGQPAFLRGWVDGFNNLNGTFGLNESKGTAVPAAGGSNANCSESSSGSGVFTCTLSWTAGNLTALQPGDVTYARFRLASVDPVSDAESNGEVEDYRIDVPGVQDRSDAPVSYGEAIHDITRNLFLGSEVDDEISSLASADALGDDNDPASGPDDEDGVATFPTTSTPDGQYTVSVSVFNDTSSDARLCGWFNYGGGTNGDVNNAFDDPAERACVNTSACTVPPPPPATQDFTCSLTWQVPEESRDNSGELFFRFRLATIASEAEAVAGTAASGEVEDYRINITTLPITLASINSGQTETELWVEWTTATETRNVGFHLYGRMQGEDTWQPLTAELIPSPVIDSLDPQRYYTAFPGVVIDELLLEDWDTQGQTTQHGPFAVGQLHGFDAVSHSQRIDWATFRAENAADQAQRKTLHSGVSRTLANATAGQADALLWVTEPGIQRIGFDALQAAGADFSAVAIADLALTDNGKARPRHVIDSNDNGLFDSGDSVEFVGTVQDTLYSARNAYRLQVDPVRVTMANTRTLGPKNAVPDIFSDSVEYEQQKAYSFAAPGADPWYDQWLFARGKLASLQRNFDLPGYAGGDAALHLRMWGVTDWPGDNDDHHLIVKINGNPVAEITYDGSVDASRTLPLPEGQLKTSGNTLTLEAPGDTGYYYDIQAFDGFSVDYPRHTQVHNGTWQGTIPREVTAKIQVSGFQGQAVAWKGRQRRVGSSTLVIKGKGDWLAADTRAIQTPTIQTEIPIPTTAPTRGAVDYLIISHAQFMDTPAMNDLVALQQGRGYTTEVIDVDSLYAAYNDFEVSADAIRTYLKAAKPRFVLLLGADSYDYHDYLGLASQSFIPTHYAQTDALVTHAPADSRHVDYNGNGIPQAALGRLPVRTVAEFTQLVAKLTDYVPPSDVVLAAGPSDGDDEFARVSVGYGTQLPQWLYDATDPAPQQQIYADDTDTDAASTALKGRLNGNEGLLVSYLGHSSYRIWGLNPSHGILLWADDARQLTNPTPHIVTQWGCWNTYFVNPNQDTMANGFLFQNHGAAAVLGATALTDLGLLKNLGETFFEHYGQYATLGEALLKAQQSYASSNPSATPSLRGFVLLGDPAAELR